MPNIQTKYRKTKYLEILIFFRIFIKKYKDMLLFKHYDKEKLVQEAWYNSSMIAYTMMVEDKDENKGDLFVTYKNGSTYKYKDVSFGDYVLLLCGGTDISQGKTMNKVIKPKYKYERVEDKNTLVLLQRMSELKEKESAERAIINSTYFISGHRDITEAEFEINYQPVINMVLEENPNAYFVVGDYHGLDIMAQNYLMDVMDIDVDRITVYHMGDAPRNINPKITMTKGGFSSDEERDAEMTRNSFQDIAFVRNNTELSGTAQNILRRHRMITLNG